MKNYKLKVFRTPDEARAFLDANKCSDTHRALECLHGDDGYFQFKKYHMIISEIVVEKPVKSLAEVLIDALKFVKR